MSIDKARGTREGHEALAARWFDDPYRPAGEVIHKMRFAVEQYDKQQALPPEERTEFYVNVFMLAKDDEDGPLPDRRA